MEVLETKLKGCFVVTPKVIGDERGYFMESFNSNLFNEAVGKVNFVQDNQSFSTKGVLRGLHYQTGTHAQAKLVRVITGEVLDVAVDLRPGSETFGQYVAEVLSEDNHKQLFVPRGFAHGFVVLSQSATFFYKCDNFYDRESEGGLIYNDPTVNIEWPTGLEFTISEKDTKLPTLDMARKVW